MSIDVQEDGSEKTFDLIGDIEQEEDEEAERGQEPADITLGEDMVIEVTQVVVDDSTMMRS